MTRGADGTVRVWDAVTGAEMVSLRGHAGRVSYGSFDKARGRIVSGGYGGTVRVSDTATGACLGVIEGTGDVEAIVAGLEGAREYPWGALGRGGETVIEPAAGGEPFGWFPTVFGRVTTHHSGRGWAGWVNDTVFVIRLEGDPAAALPMKEGAEE